MTGGFAIGLWLAAGVALVVGVGNWAAFGAPWRFPHDRNFRRFWR